MAVLKDQFGRVHDYLRMSFIDKCNLRCTYCMPENIRFLPKESLMSDTEILDFARIFVEGFGINKIRITGGEPLIRPNAKEIIQSLGKLPVQLAITTNGILLPDFLETFKQVGMRSLNISLDSLDPEKFAALTRRNAYQKVRDNIDLALKAGFKVKLNMVVMRGVNDNELLDFVALTKDPRLHARFIEFMPFDGNNWNWDTVFSYQEMLDTIGKEYKVEKLEDKAHSTSKAHRAQGFGGTFAVISTVTHPFCQSCNRIRLTAEGKLRNCLFSVKEWDLLTAHRAGEDIRPLIVDSVAAKHEKLGGLPEFQDEEALRDELSGRAMVAIGG